MKKIRLVVTFGISLFIALFNVFAEECSTEIKDALSKVNVSYKYVNDEPTAELIEKYTDDETHSIDLEKVDKEAKGKYYQIIITGLKDNMYVEISNSFDDEVVKLDKSNEKNGKITYDGKSAYEKTSYTVNVYETTTNCVADTKTVTPDEVVNEYYETDACKNNPDFELCKSELVKEKISDAKFTKQLNEFKDKKDVKNKVTIAAMILVLILVLATAVVVLGRGKKKNENLKVK